MKPIKIVLVGYPESQQILPATKYLIDKYLNANFDIEFLNYTGPIEGWASYLADYFETLTDDLVIFSLDDYLLAEPIAMGRYNVALIQLSNPEVVCSKLFPCSEQEHSEYPITTQYTIWRRTYLIWLLRQLTTPWDFEIKGSEIFKESGKLSVRNEPALKYNTSSALSKRWQGVSLKGLSYEDVLNVKARIS